MNGMKPRVRAPFILGMALLALLAASFFISGPALAVESNSTIKVLILGEKFTGVPEENEKLAIVDRVNGSLLMDDLSFNGDIEVWKGKQGLYLINELPLEEYVEGVVKAETGPEWEGEALKAQAVVVRTYVLNQKSNNGKRQFDVTSSVLHQVYKGQNANRKIADSVKATEGQILTYDGKPIEAFYHSTSAGRTEVAEDVFGKNYPYLKPVKSICRLSPYCVWLRNIPLRELEQATGIKGITEIKVASRTGTGRAKEVSVIAGGGNTAFKTADLRKMLGWKRLPSTDFTVRIEKETAVFEGKGYGHGVGLSQWSALEMAKEGKTYKEILSHFYPGSNLEKL